MLQIYQVTKIPHCVTENFYEPLTDGPEDLNVLHILNGSGYFILEILILERVEADAEVRDLRPPVLDCDVEELRAPDVALGGDPVLLGAGQLQRHVRLVAEPQTPGQRAQHHHPVVRHHQRGQRRGAEADLVDPPELGLDVRGDLPPAPGPGVPRVPAVVLLVPSEGS